ncbi:MAG: hypothetical protein S4CHLAM81_05040 [Chlamydiales bacterium]|nr:hypothetical protein [Chlamydiales bacterium]MCH9635292.1 hypothetical protein [Chlamydiales bacterium]MCH9704088.1 DUF2760 domain-containing protein [Chlamydiota bacterium]
MGFWKGLFKKKRKVEDRSHLRLLYILQKNGRLVDFLKEDISGFTDEQVGAAVRKIHEESRKSLEECVRLRPLYPDEEGAEVTVPQGYDRGHIKVVGRIKGSAPYKGVLRHKGWKAERPSLDGIGSSVVCPAEVEIQ